MTRTIRTVVDGILVTGEVISRTRSDLVVSIKRPYANLTVTAHLPAMVRSNANFAGPYGGERAKELLLELYELGRSIETRLPMLQKAYAEHLEEVRRIGAETAIRDEYDIERRRLKLSLENGSIDQATYQQAVGRLRSATEASEYEAEALWLSFLHEWIPLAFAAEPEELRAVLAGEVALLAG
jgi:hypothetical protein